MTIRANGEEAMLGQLIDWVCAACTRTFDAINNPAPPITLLPRQWTCWCIREELMKSWQPTFETKSTPTCRQ
jgi:hypothetical protein